jgi:phosphoribosylglycinamide formyltransferase-1
VTAQPKKRVAILISGRGSNMMSLVEAARAPAYPAEIVAVISNRPEAAGLAWAHEQGVPAVTVNHKAFPTREAFETELQAALDAHGAELVCCAGFLRLMTPGFVDHWRDRMLNIHPSLLPAFKGLHTHERVIEAGVKITGCTVHLVRPEMDDGPIIAQAAVAVEPGDTAETLAARVLAVEHQLYPHALRLWSTGAVSLVNEVTISKIGQFGVKPLVSPPL